jgi:hypothetical protein
VPTFDDFHGSSNITKICTQAITLEPGIRRSRRRSGGSSPTFMSVLKDRRAGATAARRADDVRPAHASLRADDYTLGRLTKGGTEWEPLKRMRRRPPGWAT